MIEFYKQVARYRAVIQHDRTHDLIEYWAEVYEGPTEGRYSIRYSHTLRPTEEAGDYFSDTYAWADSQATAELYVREWAEKLRTSYSYKPWPQD